jgi:hypothetical protein
MSKSPSTKDLDKAVAEKLAGASSKAVQDKYNLSHSQFELHFWRTVPVAQGGLAEVAGAFEPTTTNVVWLRQDRQCSWGQISIACAIPESRVRKLWKEGTGKLSQGVRIGHGGRWFLNERELYTDGLQRPGTEITEAEAKALSTRIAALEAAAEQKLIHKEIGELRELAKAEGVSPKGTKAQIVIRIKKARSAKAKATQA